MAMASAAHACSLVDALYCIIKVPIVASTLQFLGTRDD